MEEKKGLIKTKKQMFLVIGVFTLVMLLGTVTYAFFNYTRTGSSNVIKTGRISFNTTQDGNINLTNVFPITSSEAETDTTNAKSVTINVTGDTDYGEGLEYLVTLADVNLEANGKTLPIALEITQEGLGTEEEGDYYTAHTSYTNANKYKVLYDGKLKNDARVLAGYIAPNTVSGTSNNTSGTITIKAYIDKSKILISDTYPEKTVRKVKTEGFSATACESATGLASGSSICASASALQTELDSGSTLTSNQITALLNAGIITEYTDGTPASMAEGKTVFTTEEWNSIQGSPLSFKVKVESNEGKWIEEPISNCTLDLNTVNVVQSYKIDYQNCSNAISNYYAQYGDDPTEDIAISCVDYVRDDSSTLLYSGSELMLLFATGKSTAQLEQDGIIRDVIYTHPSSLLSFMEYQDDNFTYTYNYESATRGSYYGSSLSGGWYAKLTNKSSTNPIVISNMCSSINNTNVVSMKDAFSESNAQSINLSGLNTRNIDDMSSMFEYSKATSIIIDNMDTRNVKNMSKMFNSTRAASIDFSTLNTSNVENMQEMFSYTGANTINLANVNTSKVTNMEKMFFYAGANITEIDLSSFSTASNPSVCSMFYFNAPSPANLTTIYASNKWNPNTIHCNNGLPVISGGYPLLKGGNGTMYTDVGGDIQYVRIDSISSPGLFTDISQKPAS